MVPLNTIHNDNTVLLKSTRYVESKRQRINNKTIEQHSATHLVPTQKRARLHQKSN